METTEETLAAQPREPWLAVNLSMLLPGLGQMYARRPRRGLAILAASVAASGCALWQFFSATGSMSLGVCAILAATGLEILILFDAHRCAAKANPTAFETARKQAKDPWLAVFLSRIVIGVGHLYLKRVALGVLLLLAVGAYLWFEGRYAILFFLSPLPTAAVCWDAYRTAPVRREPSRRWIGAMCALLGPVTVGLLCLPLLVKEYAVEAFVTPGRGMAPTIQPGDRFLVNKLSGTCRRGEVIAFRPPGKRRSKHVMRVAAVAGERVEIRNGALCVNGEAFRQAPFDKLRYDESRRHMWVIDGPFRVPTGCVFVLGDNSAWSLDSRFYGCVPAGNVIGKAYRIYWPLHRAGPIR